MKRDHKNLTNKDEIARLTFYYFRNIAFSKYTYESYSAREIGYMPSSIFAKVMYDAMEEYDIPCEIIVMPDRSISKIDDIVIASELNYCIKVNNHYMFTFDEFSNYNDIDPDLEGQEGYAVKIARNETKRNAIKTTAPTSTSTRNASLFEMNVKIDADMETLQVEEKNMIKGLSKRFYNTRVLKYYDWEKTDYKAYGSAAPEDKAPLGNKSKIAEQERIKKAEEEENVKNQNEEMKEFLKEDFDNVISYDAFKVVDDGRRSEKPDLTYTESFKLGDLIKKVGPNYTLNAGALIGDQVEIGEDERKREHNVWLSFPRTIAYSIGIEIPEGYKVEGLDALQYNVDNNTGSFISTSKLEGQRLTLDVKKVYKQNFATKEDWPKMVEFLDAAYDFTQKKIVLTKGK